MGKRRDEFGEAKGNSSKAGLNSTGSGQTDSSRRREVGEDAVRIPPGSNREGSLGDRSNSEGKLGGGVKNYLRRKFVCRRISGWESQAN